MSELDDFEAKVRQQIKLLSAPDAKTRRKAAAWLGEAGDPNAITRLKQVYEEDPDRKVREAAAYSLGMFRALQIGMAGKDSERVYELLENIALRGKMGGRVPIPVGFFKRLLVALLVSLVILAAFNFIIWPQYEDEINGFLGLSDSAVALGNPSATGRDALVAEVEAFAAAIREDAITLQTQYTSVQTGAELDCAIAFNNPISYDTGSMGENDDLAAIAILLNGQILNLVTAKAPYNQACANPESAPAPDQLVGPQSTLSNLLAEVTTIEADLAAAASGEAPASEVDSDVPETTPDAAEPEAEPTTAVDEVGVVPLFAILDEVRSARGAVTLLAAFWEGASDNLAASGCNEPTPTIPENYVVPPNVRITADLQLAVDLINSGLAFTRQGWDLKQSACASGDLLNNRESGLMLATNAGISFDSAETKLNQVLEAGR